MFSFATNPYRKGLLVVVEVKCYVKTLFDLKFEVTSRDSVEESIVQIIMKSILYIVE